jgi:Mg2+ and Co2+ transporter CorA
MNSTEANSRADVLRLTKAAAEAAELGRWDAVVQCYSERGALLEAMQTPVQEASDLLKLDEQIRDRVRTVQAVLASLLGEATATRQRLQGLHQKLGGQPSTAMTVSMKA